MIFLFVFSFISGLLTILAPCIWPLLPVVLSTTSTGGKMRPLAVTIGIIASFGFFTLFISYILKIIPFDTNYLRLFAVIIITFMGLTLLIPKLSELMEGGLSRLSSRFGAKYIKNDEGLRSGLITGVALGLVWTPCAGPILATIATLAATQSLNTTVILMTFFYVVGVGIPLFAFSFLGKNLINKSRFISKNTRRLQQIFGVVMILTAAAIFLNLDKAVELNLLNLIPSYSNYLNQIESNPLIKNQLDNLKGRKASTQIPNSSTLQDYGQAVDFTGISNWLNLPDGKKTLTLKDLRGKVVLVDFWTYTCINCIRTLPHVISWYEKYKDQGFVVVGVHTPEFDFEKNTQNVINATKQYRIHYPVAQDNNYATWNAYNNEFWPAEYLIDAKGEIRREHFGEGEYDVSEMAIKSLLAEAGKKVDQKLVNVPDQTPTQNITPETYIGLDRRERYLNPDETQTPPLNYFSYRGKWDLQSQYATSNVGSQIILHFYASKVHLVITPNNLSDKVKIFLDDKFVSNIVFDKNHPNDLYTLIDLNGETEEHILRLEFDSVGTKIYAFTFS